MRSFVVFAAIFGAGVFLSGCGSDVPVPSDLDSKSAERDSKPTDESAADAKGNDNVVGGYGKASVENAEVLKAAEFATAEESKKGSALKLVSIVNAESQVVAGMNYRLTLTVDDAGVAKTAEAVVYQDLKQNLSLSSWEWK